MKYTLLLLLSFLFVAAQAQQDPLYSQYLINPFTLSPAYAGYYAAFNASAGYRQQWGGMDGPETFNFSADVSLRENRLGTGLLVMSDRIGATSRTDIMASFAYKVMLSGETRFSFGLQAGAANYRVDNSRLSVFDTSDPLFQGTTSEWSPNIGAGFLLSSDRFSVGVSAPRLLESSLTVNLTDYTLLSRHYYLSAAYMFDLSPKISFEPSLMVRYVSGAPVSTDVNASIIFDRKFQAGVFTRNLNAYGVLMQLLIKSNLRLGYVFEMPSGEAVHTRFVTHEITLGIRLNVFTFHKTATTIGL